jgi:hypothetical protein
VSPEQIRDTILGLLDQRDPGKTICPSDAARALAAEAFRPLMDPVRAVVAELVAEGKIEVTQHGKVVDISTAHGPVRLGRRPQRGSDRP